MRKWGGSVEDYLPIHEWFDETKAHFSDPRHRALRHHSEGIFLMESIFGKTITLSSGRELPTRYVGEQHVSEDLGSIPAAADWLRAIAAEPWMRGPSRRSLVVGLEAPPPPRPAQTVVVP